MSLQITDLVKRFGETVALGGISFGVEPGTVFGFLGANGAGKTTTMRIVLDIIRADAGTVTWQGMPSTHLPRRTFGYLPEERGLYPRMKVVEQLAFFAGLYGVPRRVAEADARAWLARFRIPDYADRRAEELSKGNQQKVQFIAAVLHDPDVLIMDEPFTGLDPVNVALLKAAFLEMRDHGKTLIFSTHQMEMAEELCDAVAIIDRGLLVANGSTPDVRRSLGTRMVRLGVAGDPELPWLDGLVDLRVVRSGRDHSDIQVSGDRDPETVLTEAQARGERITHFEIADPSLEQVFVELVGRDATAAEERTLASVPAGELRPPVAERAGWADMASIRPRNVLLVARREYLVRARTRSFKIATALLVAGAILIALLPVILRYFEGSGTGDRVGIRAEAQLAGDPVAGFAAFLDVPTLTGAGSAFTFSAVADEADGRSRVGAGDLRALVVITRATDADLAFTIVSSDGLAARVPTLLRQAASAIAIQDRLDRQGITAAEQAALFAPPAVIVERPAPDKPGAPTAIAEVAGAIVGQILVVFIFVAIILYGQWVAMSVAEEKSSRVIEVVINAATPSELLGGKVLGVGALGLTQYLVAVIPAALGFIFQDRIAALLLGSRAEVATTAGGMGLTPTVMIVFGIFFILGFMLYATLYAAAGSLVSRMEDVNSVVGPMTMVGMVGYLVAVYASSGLIPIDAGWVIVFSFVPFVSPYLMLSRVVLGVAGPLDVALAVAILLLTILGALWMAARVYSAGVLMYGQKAGFRTLFSTAFGRRR